MTQTIHILDNVILSQAVFDYLTSHDTISGRIHSIFQNGFNIQCGDYLLYVSFRKHSLGPFDIQFSQRHFQTIRPFITIGQPITLNKIRLKIAGATSCQLSFYSYHLVDTSLPDVILNRDALELLLHSLTQYENDLNSGRHSSKALDETINQLNEGTLAFEQFIRMIFGLGIGLTPSGDDMLQSMLVLESVLDSRDQVRLQVLESLQLSQTTDVSTSYYHLILQGFVGQDWRRLLLGLDATDADAVSASLQSILSVGQTSGADSLLGLVLYLRYLLEVT